MEVKRGQVYWVENKIDYRNVNPVDPSKGKKYRPALVIAPAEERDKYRKVNVVYLTQHPAEYLETDVTIHKTVHHKVEGNVAICKRIYTIKESELDIRKYIDTLSTDDMKNVDIALAKATGLRILGDKGTEAILPITLPSELKSPFKIAKREEKPFSKLPKSVTDELICIGCAEKEYFAAMKKRAEVAEKEREFYKRMYHELLDKLIEK